MIVPSLPAILSYRRQRAPTAAPAGCSIGGTEAGAAPAPLGTSQIIGEYALRLGWSGYPIHGTNKPYGVGRNVSHGCIRLYPEDIERLFREVSSGTPVRVMDREFRLAWIEHEPLLAAYPSKAQSDELSVNESMTPAIQPDPVQQISDAAGAQIDRVDWSTVEYIGLHRPGIPYRITRPVPS